MTIIATFPVFLLSRLCLALFVLLRPPLVTAQAGGDNPVRSTMSSLLSRIKELDAAKNKVAPFVSSGTGKFVVPVHAFVDVLYLTGLDDQQLLAHTATAFILTWHDASLAWNASQYGGVDWLEVPADSLWTPDWIVANDVDNNVPMDHISGLAVNSTGFVSLQVVLYLKTVCSMNHKYFPFDNQTCPIILFAYNEYIQWNISIRPPGVELSDLIIHPLQSAQENEWSLIEVREGYMVETYHKRVMPFVMLHARRNTLFYVIHLLLPMICTSYISILVFLLPPESGEKMSFLVSILVSVSVYIGFLSETMPRGLDRMPGCTTILVVIMLESVLILIATTVVLRKFHAEQRRPPICPRRDDGDKERAENSFVVENTNPTGSASGVGFTVAHRIASAKVAPLAAGGNGGNKTGGANHDGNVATRAWFEGITAQALDFAFFAGFMTANTVVIGGVIVFEIRAHMF